MKNGVKAVPDGFHTVTPHLILKNGSAAIEFYKKAFGAKELFQMPGPDGRLMHAEIVIGDSIVMLADEFPEMGARGPQTLGGSTVTISLYVEDMDAVFNQALAAGAQVRMPPMDMFWGDRYGQVTDPFGHVWSLCTHKEDVSPEELAKRAQAAFAGAPEGCREPAHA
jgi:uncharacterized glyoxalase superfamily protein PhnB